MIHVAISDNGMGLQKSFEGTSLEPELTSPLLALQKAMEPEVSGALLRPLTGPYAQYVNRGIGLSMVYRIVQLHGGEITVESIKGEGARFTIRLPAVPA